MRLRPLTRSVSVAGSLTQTRSGFPLRILTVGARVSEPKGNWSAVVPTTSIASTTAS